MATKIKRYYTDRILKEYEAGLAAEIPTILDALSKDMRSEGWEVETDFSRDGGSEVNRLKIFERLDRFEPKFFQHLEKARKRVLRT